MIVVAIILAIFYNAIKDTDACVSYKYDYYGDLSFYDYYGDPSFYDDAEACAYTNSYIYDCYCSTNGGSGCEPFDRSCELLFDDSYQSTVQASYIIPVVCIIIAVLFSCLSCICLCCPPEYFHIESLNETNVGVGSVFVATPPKSTNDMTVMAVVTIAEHDNFNNQPAAFNHGQSSVWVPVDDSYNSRPVVASAPSINYA